jgi:hypothetical protein
VWHHLIPSGACTVAAGNWPSAAEGGQRMAGMRPTWTQGQTPSPQDLQGPLAPHTSSPHHHLTTTLGTSVHRTHPLGASPLHIVPHAADGAPLPAPGAADRGGAAAAGAAAPAAPAAGAAAAAAPPTTAAAGATPPGPSFAAAMRTGAPTGPATTPALPPPQTATQTALRTAPQTAPPTASQTAWRTATSTATPRLSTGPPPTGSGAQT